MRAIIALSLVVGAAAHGRMTVPSARNAIWQDGPTEAIKMAAVPDYNLDGLAAGGPGVVPLKGHGLCGDAATGPQDHMAGGKFGRAKNDFKPLIVASYKPGQVFETQVVLTAHHEGFFEWRICNPYDGSGKGPEPNQITQACLDKHRIPLADPSEGMRYADWNPTYKNRADRAHLWDEPQRVQSLYKYKVPPANPWTINRYTIKLRMPDITCERCVIQWYYQTGNTQGAYPEEFWNCADVEVGVNNFNISPPILATQTAEDAEQQLGKCGLSGTESGRKCFSKDVRVTDSWCDKLKCDPAFSSMCTWADVDADCKILVPIVKAGSNTPPPTPSQWTYMSPGPSSQTPVNTANYNYGNTNTNTNYNGGGVQVAARPYNYNFWQNNWNYNQAAVPSAGGKGGKGGKTVTTTTSTTTSTYH